MWDGTCPTCGGDLAELWEGGWSLSAPSGRVWAWHGLVCLTCRGQWWSRGQERITIGDQR